MDPGMAPHGYFASHDPWEHLPDIIAYHTLPTRDDIDQYTEQERAIIARAYTIHDQHFNITLNDHLNGYLVTQEAINRSVAKQISSYIEKKITDNPELINSILNGSSGEVLQGMQLDTWWQSTQSKYDQLLCMIRDGVITDLGSYYDYMCRVALGDVLAQGW